MATLSTRVHCALHRSKKKKEAGAAVTQTDSMMHREEDDDVIDDEDEDDTAAWGDDGGWLTTRRTKECEEEEEEERVESAGPTPAAAQQQQRRRRQSRKSAEEEAVSPASSVADEGRFGGFDGDGFAAAAMAMDAATFGGEDGDFFAAAANDAIESSDSEGSGGGGGAATATKLLHNLLPSSIAAFHARRGVAASSSSQQQSSKKRSRHSSNGTALPQPPPLLKAPSPLLSAQRHAKMATTTMKAQQQFGAFGDEDAAQQQQGEAIDGEDSDSDGDARSAKRHADTVAATAAAAICMNIDSAAADTELPETDAAEQQQLQWIADDANPIRRALLSPHASAAATTATATATATKNGRSSWLAALDSVVPTQAAAQQDSPRRPVRFVSGGLCERLHRLVFQPTIFGNPACAQQTEPLRVMLVGSGTVQGGHFYARCWVCACGEAIPDAGLHMALFPAALSETVAGRTGLAMTLHLWRAISIGGGGDFVIACSRHATPEIASAEELSCVPAAAVSAPAPATLFAGPHAATHAATALAEPVFDGSLQIVGMVERVAMLPVAPEDNIGTEARAMLLISSSSSISVGGGGSALQLREIVVQDSVARRSLGPLLHASGRMASIAGLRSVCTRDVSAEERRALECLDLPAVARIVRLAATDAFRMTLLAPPHAGAVLRPHASGMPLCTLSELHAIANSAGEPRRASVVGVVLHATAAAVWLVDGDVSVRLRTAGVLAASLAGSAALVRGDVVLLRQVLVRSGDARIDRLSTAEKLVPGDSDSVTAFGRDGWLLAERGIDAAGPRADPLLNAAIAAAAASASQFAVCAPSPPEFAWMPSSLGVLASVSGRIVAVEESISSLCDECGQPAETYDGKGGAPLHVCRRCACLSAHTEACVTATLASHGDGGFRLHVTATGNGAVAALQKQSSCVDGAALGPGACVSGLVCSIVFTESSSSSLSPSSAPAEFSGTIVQMDC